VLQALETGRSGLHLKVSNIALISMIAAPPTGQVQSLHLFDRATPAGKNGRTRRATFW